MSFNPPIYVSHMEILQVQKTATNIVCRGSAVRFFVPSHHGHNSGHPDAPLCTHQSGVYRRASRCTHTTCGLPLLLIYIAGACMLDDSITNSMFEVTQSCFRRILLFFNDGRLNSRLAG